MRQMEDGKLVVQAAGGEEEDAEGTDNISTSNRKSLARVVERRRAYSDMRALVDGVESSALGDLTLVMAGGDFAANTVQLCALMKSQESNSATA